MRSGFSQVVNKYSGKKGSHIRLKTQFGEALVPGDTLELKEACVDPEELEEAEAKAIPGQRLYISPQSRSGTITIELISLSGNGAHSA